jgi:hypothetical protein
MLRRSLARASVRAASIASPSLPVAASLSTSLRALVVVPCGSGAGATRAFSSASSSSSSAASDAFAWVRRNVTVTNLKTYWPQVAAGTGALVVFYGISSASVHVATTLLELDMKQVFYAGFLTGVLTSAALGAGAFRLYRTITIAPDAVYRAALQKLARNSVIRGEIGSQLRSGHLKAYVAHPGHLSMDKKFGWVEPRLQMLFQVVGDKGEGIATAEAVKHKSGIVFSLLTVDTLARPGNPSSLILVAGKEEKLHVRGTLRGFLQTERAQYVEQDRTERDDDRMAEQEELPNPAPAETEEGKAAAAAAATASAAASSASATPPAEVPAAGSAPGGKTSA